MNNWKEQISKQVRIGGNETLVEALEGIVENIVAQSNSDLLKEIKDLIVKEANIARSENQPTSRLTSLYNKLEELIKQRVVD